MKRNIWIALIVAVVIIFMFSCYKREEMFDNSGALMQLSADHVPDNAPVPEDMF